MNFLEGYDFNSIPLNLQIVGLKPICLFLGEGSQPLEIASFSSSKKPTNAKAQEAFRKRRARRAAAVLIVVTHPEGVNICGTSGEQPPIYHLKDQNQVERLCVSSLMKPNRNAAIRFLSESIPSLETDLPGFTNEGLLSSHELIYGVKNNSKWEYAEAKSKNIFGKRDADILSSLGFNRSKLDNLTELVYLNKVKIAISFFLKEDEIPNISNKRFNNISPITYALTKGDSEKVPWVLMIQGDRLRLYNTKNIGISKKGRSDCFIECQLSLVSTNDLGLIWFLFSSEAISDDGYIYEILENSKRFASDIATQLRERIYESVIPYLAMGIIKARKLDKPKKNDVKIIYEMALKILFRLLFIAYAEDRDLLPYKGNEIYRTKSLKQKAILLQEQDEDENNIKKGTDVWEEISILWDAISLGKKEWGIPAYEGTIFSKDINVSLSGAELSKISLENKYFETALRNLLLTESKDLKKVPIDFRSLSVREFGTIYEGLLESELSIAEQNLTIDKKGSYLPTTKDSEINVLKGEIYLHDSSGARKTSGSFYTPDFAVEYLLDESLEPALTKHLDSLNYLSEYERAENLFNFRVADISMGSGHFLVAAIDRIENRFATWLQNNKVPGVLRELEHMREAAKKELGELSNTFVIKDSQLLRRMIARRCIFGVDLNPITVQLARLSIWIHTFIPGLPLSLLDHNLVEGNSLVGVESLEQIRKRLNQGEGTLFEINASSLLEEAAAPLKKLASLSDASIKDIKEGRLLLKEAKKKISEIKALCDLITAQPVSNEAALKGFMFENWTKEREDIEKSKALEIARNILKDIKVVHFPVLFPEVFLGSNAGFNVIVGNPPWEKIMMQENEFFGRYLPGLRGLSQIEYVKQKKLLKKDRPDLIKQYESEKKYTDNLRSLIQSSSENIFGSGHPDLYISFCFKFLNLLSNKNGIAGVVLPRSSISAKGSENFRRKLFQSVNSIKLTLLKNTKQWIFKIHPQYTISLTTFSKTTLQKGLTLEGPHNSLSSLFDRTNKSSRIFKINEVLNWNDTLSLPIFPKPESVEVFAKFQKHPRLDLDIPESWRVRPIQEMNTTTDADKMSYSEECPEGFWKVYKGASFDIWQPETGEYNSWANPQIIFTWLNDKISRANSSSRNSVYKEFPKNYFLEENNLPPVNPRIAFRDITRATDSRTVRCALIPPQTFVTNKAPILMFPRGDQKDEAFLLGVLSSIPLDWYARRFVETNLSFFILNPLPIPRPGRENKLWQKTIKISGRLASTDERFKNWSQKVGVEFGPLDSSTKFKMICELDAIISHLYKLEEEDVIHIYKTFHEGWDYEERLNKVLDYYHIYRA